MELPNAFKNFLAAIRPTENQRNDSRTGHSTLRDRLLADERLRKIVVSTFLQGSYRRATAIRPKGEIRSDVDVIVVTDLDRNDYPDPSKAMDLLVPFLDEYYIGKYRRQGRSFAIELSYVDLDLVLTSAPSEADKRLYKSAAVMVDSTPDEEPDWMLTESWRPQSERGPGWAAKASIEPEWKTAPLWIPDRDGGIWEQTHPLEQIKWTWGKNTRTKGHYVNVIKALKWWQRVHYDGDQPSGYPLEHLIGQTCPDGIGSVAEGVTRTLEAIVTCYGGYAQSRQTPFLADHGVPTHNVLGRVSGEEFADFHDHARAAAPIARSALEETDRRASARLWRQLFEERFPGGEGGEDEETPPSGSKGPFVAAGVKSVTGDSSPRRYGQAHL